MPLREISGMGVASKKGYNTGLGKPRMGREGGWTAPAGLTVLLSFWLPHLSPGLFDASCRELQLGFSQPCPGLASLWISQILDRGTDTTVHSGPSHAVLRATHVPWMKPEDHFLSNFGKHCLRTANAKDGDRGNQARAAPQC